MADGIDQRRTGLRAVSRLLLPSSVAWSAVSLFVALAVIATLLWRPRPWLLWNASPSSPVGLYALTSPARLQVGDTAVAWPPMSARRVAAARYYVPLRVPLVKRVAAVAGDQVCARRGRIFINGQLAAWRKRRDPSGRLMPWWSGCIRLEHGQTFLLSQVGPHAFDGRYFGVTRTGELVARGRLLWRMSTKASNHA